MNCFKAPLFLIALVLSTNLLATEQTIYASNNSNIISLPDAYLRLQNEPEQELKNTVIQILQENHIEQGRFQEILGAYTMSDSQQVTCDNT